MKMLKAIPMKILQTSILAVVLIFPFCASLFAEDTMDFVYFDNFPPFSWEDSDKQMQGILIDIVDEVIRDQMNINVTHSGYPWARAQIMVKDGTADAFITVPTPEREEYTKISSEPVIVTKVTLFTKKNHEKMEDFKNVQKISDLEPFRLVDYLGNGWALKNLAKFNVEWSPQIENVLHKLAHNRGDLFVQVSQVTHYTVKKLGLEDQIVEIPTVLDSAPFNLCIGRHSPFIGILPQFEQILSEMRNNGKLQEIHDKYR
jgi:polar amino acid transport system substrate-binding protein